MSTVKARSDYGFEIIVKNGMNLNESQKFVDDIMDRADPEWVASKKEVYLLNESLVYKDHGSDEMKTFEDGGMVQLNESEGLTGMIIGGAVTIAVCVASLVREYKKLAAKDKAAGKQLDKKKLLLAALSATAAEIQRAKA
jgi:hypothetical protein